MDINILENIETAQMDRRSFVKAVGAVGATLLTQTYLSDLAAASAKHLVIAGHGQGPSIYDPGAVYKNKENKIVYTEADLVRNLINYMKKYSGTKIDYVTTKNVYAYQSILDYKGYSSITEIHLNAFDKTAQGCEVQIKKGFTPDKLDKALLATLSKYFKNRGFTYRNDLYNMNTCAKNRMNYRLIECCFIDNKNDVDKFISNMDAIAKGFVTSITSF